MPPSSTARSEQGVSSSRALVVAALALFADNLVVGLAVPVLPLVPSVVAAGPAWTGVLFASCALAVVASAVLAGRLVDRVGPRMPLLLGMVGLALATLLFATLGPFWLLLIARVAQGIAGGMSWVAALSLISSTTSVDRRGQQMGIALSTVTLGVLIGPPLGGFMAQHLGPASPFLLAAAVALVDGVLRIVLIRDSPPAAETSSGPRAVLRVPGTVAISVVVILGASVMSGIQPVLPAHLGAGSVVLGVLFGLAALASVIANPVVGRMVAGTSARLLVGLGVFSAMAALVVLGAAGALWQTAIGMVMVGISAALVQAPATMLMSEQGFKAAPPTLGGSFALYTLVYALGLALGPMMTGFAVQHAGFEAAMIITAGVLVTVGGLALVRVPVRVEHAPLS